MQLNSTYFIFCFLPLFLAIYYLVPAKWRNIPLLLGSLVFYGFNASLWMFIPMLVLTFFAYFIGRSLHTPRNFGLLVLGIVYFLLVLVFFKIYAGGKFLPIGISFYLFQLAAYLFSVYRRKIPAESDLLRFGTQIFMFPRLLSGPIMDSAELQQQTASRCFSAQEFHKGLRELIVGLAFKVVIANRLGGLWAQAGVVGYGDISPVFAWLALLAFAGRLYFDFYGYSLMAVGIGRMLGFRLPQNFDDPYASRSVSEFYRRWHITLGAWFREFIYIPMGGNRKGMGRTILNLLFVWLLTGLWHGIGGNYLLWAGMIAFAVIMERLWLGSLLKKSRVLCHIYTVFWVLLTWVPFAIGDWGKMTSFFGSLFGIGSHIVNPLDFVGQCKNYVWLLIAAVVFASPLPKLLLKKLPDNRIVNTLTDIFLFVIFWISMYFIATSAQDPFMYFQY